MSKSLQVLILEDQPADAELMVYELHHAGFEIEWQRVDTAADYVAHLNPNLDLILADYSLPQFDASRALDILQKQNLDIPFIIITGAVGEEVAVACIKQGAADYLLKDRLTRLGEAVNLALQKKDLRQEREQALMALQASEERFRSIFELAPVGIAIVDNQGHFIQVNQACQDMFGYQITEFRHLTFSNLTHSDDLATSRYLFQRVLDQEIDYFRLEKRYFHKSGRLIWSDTTVFAVQHADNILRHTIAVLHDITERKEAEESAQYLATIVESSDDAIIGKTLDGTIVSWNTGAEQIYGYSAADVISQHINILVPDGQPDETPYILGKICLGEAVKHYETVQQCKLGDLVNVSLTISPIRDKNGQITGASTIAHDITNRKRAEAQIRQANIRLAQAYDETLAGWAKALELRDQETEGHSQRVTEMTVQLAEAMGFSEAELVHVRRGALLHDIGKMGIPDNILLKPGPLTEEEWQIMRQHPVYAYEMLSPIEYLKPALIIPCYHHERWDGSGYPRGLKGTEIPLAARIFAVVDVWDALTSDRPYRSAWSPAKAYAHICEQSGTSFDPQVVQMFRQLVGNRVDI